MSCHTQAEIAAAVKLDTSTISDRIKKITESMEIPQLQEIQLFRNFEAQIYTITRQSGE